MMKSLWNSFKIAFAMFSKIPMPQADWSEENMRYMLCFFPFVGAAVGVVMLGMEWLCRYFGMSNGFIAVALVLVPVIVTGGIHVDGLLDTSDALSSWRDREKRLEILKDSHAGAFAVITACVYFLTMYGGMSQIVEQDNRKMLYILFLFLSAVKRHANSAGSGCSQKTNPQHHVAAVPGLRISCIGRLIARAGLLSVLNRTG